MIPGHVNVNLLETRSLQVLKSHHIEMITKKMTYQYLYVKEGKGVHFQNHTDIEQKTPIKTKKEI